MFAITSLSFFVLQTMINYSQVDAKLNALCLTHLNSCYHDLQCDLLLFRMESLRTIYNSCN
jgi:hypothetical protein